MKKKTGEECKRAVNLGVLFAVQLGDEFNHLVTKFSSTLMDWVCDWTLNADFRSECVNALSLYTFLTTDDLELIGSALNSYREIWTRIKPNGAIEYSQLSCSCLNAWALMLLCLPDRYIENAIQNDLPILCDYIENGHPDIRITSGETLCLLYEMANQLTAYEEFAFKPVNHDKTLAVLEQWSHESAKFHAKRDRRVQRATFRDVHAAIKNNDVPEIKIKFGTENLTLDSWAMKLCYSMLCTFLRGGINTHLQQNYVIRDKLSLGAPISEAVSHKATKLERQIFNQSVNKARNLARGKQRDKKPAFCGDD
uniref:Interferon-related developmental regulator 1 n=1 Tax=Romanomermis culicivorax TaxID=13658 RepID=A0A915JXW2_ROMCU